MWGNCLGSELRGFQSSTACSVSPSCSGVWKLYHEQGQLMQGSAASALTCLIIYLWTCASKVRWARGAGIWGEEILAMSMSSALLWHPIRVRYAWHPVVQGGRGPRVPGSSAEGLTPQGVTLSSQSRSNQNWFCFFSDKDCIYLWWVVRCSDMCLPCRMIKIKSLFHTLPIFHAEKASLKPTLLAIRTCSGCRKKHEWPRSPIVSFLKKCATRPWLSQPLMLQRWWQRKKERNILGHL